MPPDGRHKHYQWSEHTVTKKFLSESDQVSGSMSNHQLIGNKEHRGSQ